MNPKEQLDDAKREALRELREVATDLGLLDAPLGLDKHKPEKWWGCELYVMPEEPRAFYDSHGAVILEAIRLGGSAVDVVDMGFEERTSAEWIAWARSKGYSEVVLVGTVGEIGRYPV